MPLFRDCARCKRLKQGICRGTATWWPLKEVWLCRVQCMFLMEQLLALELGKYPQNPYESGYTEAEHTSTRIGANAPFETALQCRGELVYRLGRTDVAGKWLIDYAQRGGEIQGMPNEPRQALHYISGWWRKRIPFSVWQWRQENKPWRKPIRTWSDTVAMSNWPKTGTVSLPENAKLDKSVR